ncbi:MAG: tol-pal system protein YbgF [Magnetococcales bacterium]|nr:tol-pal system protein YbgF [Magnetococcales bacterium]
METRRICRIRPASGRLVILGLSLGLLQGCGIGAPPPGAGAEDPARELSNEEKQLIKLNKTIEELAAENRSARLGQADVTKRLSLMEQEVQGLRNELDQTRHRNLQLTQQIESLQNRPDPGLAATAAITLPGTADSPGAPVMTAQISPAMQPAPALAAQPPANAAPPPAGGAVVVPAASPQPPAAVSRPMDPEQAYEQAYGILKTGHYSRALESLQNFITWFPEHSLSANAQYWVGECHYVQKNYAEALKSFNQVLIRWPNSPKVPDSLLKIGFSLMSLQELDKAVAILSRVTKEFPQTKYDAMARQQIQEINAKRGQVQPPQSQLPQAQPSQGQPR